MALPTNSKAPDLSSAAAKNTFVVAAFSQLLKDAGISPSTLSPMVVLSQLATAFATNGKLDSSNSGVTMSAAATSLASHWASGLSIARTNYVANTNARAYAETS